jgi:hypothetical protein
VAIAMSNPPAITTTTPIANTTFTTIITVDMVSPFVSLTDNDTNRLPRLSQCHKTPV